MDLKLADTLSNETDTTKDEHESYMFTIYDAETDSTNNECNFWGVAGRHLNINNDTVTNNGVKYQTVYSKDFVNCGEFSNMTIEWTIEIIKKTSLIMIGITNNVDFPNYCYWSDKAKNSKSKYYTYYNCGQKTSHKIKKWDSYGSTFDSNDIITIKLNLQNKELKYYKNGKSMGVAFGNIEISKNINYYLAI